MEDEKNSHCGSRKKINSISNITFSSGDCANKSKQWKYGTKSSAPVAKLAKNIAPSE